MNTDILEQGFSRLCLNFHRPYRQELCDLWRAELSKYDSDVVKGAYQDVIRCETKFPALATMLIYVEARIRSKRAAPESMAVEEVGKDGKPIPVQLDADGTRRYRARDTAEGRAFLQELAKITKNTTLPE
jgi:hypothetical protein